MLSTLTLRPDTIFQRRDGSRRRVISAVFDQMAGTADVFSRPINPKGRLMTTRIRHDCETGRAIPRGDKFNHASDTNDIMYILDGESGIPVNKLTAVETGRISFAEAVDLKTLAIGDIVTLSTRVDAKVLNIGFDPTAMTTPFCVTILFEHTEHMLFFNEDGTGSLLSIHKISKPVVAPPVVEEVALSTAAPIVTSVQRVGGGTAILYSDGSLYVADGSLCDAVAVTWRKVELPK